MIVRKIIFPILKLLFFYIMTTFRTLVLFLYGFSLVHILITIKFAIKSIFEIFLLILFSIVRFVVFSNIFLNYTLVSFVLLVVKLGFP